MHNNNSIELGTSRAPSPTSSQIYSTNYKNISRAKKNRPIKNDEAVCKNRIIRKERDECHKDA